MSIPSCKFIQNDIVVVTSYSSSELITNSHITKNKVIAGIEKQTSGSRGNYVWISSCAITISKRSFNSKMSIQTKKFVNFLSFPRVIC